MAVHATMMTFDNDAVATDTAQVIDGAAIVRCLTLTHRSVAAVVDDDDGLVLRRCRTRSGQGSRDIDAL